MLIFFRVKCHDEQLWGVELFNFYGQTLFAKYQKLLNTYTDEGYNNYFEGVIINNNFERFFNKLNKSTNSEKISAELLNCTNLGLIKGAEIDNNMTLGYTIRATSSKDTVISFHTIKKDINTRNMKTTNYEKARKFITSLYSIEFDFLHHCSDGKTINTSIYFREKAYVNIL